jgi:hypothetical protein
MPSCYNVRGLLGRYRRGKEMVRLLMIAGFVLAAGGTGGLAQEGSCVGALESRISAVEAVMDTMPRLDANCSELKERLDAFVAAELALKKSDKAVRRACPAGAHVRGSDADGSVRFQFILEAAKKRLADCPQPTKK